MNKALKVTLLLLGGAAIGGLVTWLSVKEYYHKQAQKLVDEIRKAHQLDSTKDIEDMKEDLKRAKEAANELGKLYMEAVYGPDPSVPPSPNLTIEEDIAYAQAAKTAIQYHKIAQREMAKPLPDEDSLPPEYDIPGTPFKHAWELPKELDPYYKPEEDMHPEDDDYEEGPVFVVKPPDDPEPYLITAEEYVYDLNHDDCLCSQECLTYYLGDKVLVDENDDPVDIEIVGEENLKVLEDGDDVIFVRNFECGVEYEIQKSEGSFNE